jgi:hypothetical protein
LSEIKAFYSIIMSFTSMLFKTEDITSLLNELTTEAILEQNGLHLNPQKIMDFVNSYCYLSVSLDCLETTMLNQVMEKLTVAMS